MSAEFVLLIGVSVQLCVFFFVARERLGGVGLLPESAWFGG
jgi:hypothetical protein